MSYVTDYLTWDDRLAFAKRAYAKGDMVAHVAACWSCDRRPIEDNLVSDEINNTFFDADQDELINLVETWILEGRA